MQFNTNISLETKQRINKYSRTMGIHFYEISEVALRAFLEKNEPVAQERRARWEAVRQERAHTDRVRKELWDLRIKTGRNVFSEVAALRTPEESTKTPDESGTKKIP